MLLAMIAVNAGLVGGLLLVAMIDLSCALFLPGAPRWWRRVSDVLFPGLLTADAVYWLAIGQPGVALLLGSLALLICLTVYVAFRHRRRVVNEPNG